MSKNLIDRLDEGPVICAEGFLFEIERRGYMASGEFVPMVSLDHPEVLENLHREFQHAGSDVVEAFTYNGHREKMRVIGKEELLEPLNRAALKIAKKAHQALGCKGVTRSDFKFFKNKFYLLEINTQPGMTDLSLVPEIANYKGISFENLVEKILLNASLNR